MTLAKIVPMASAALAISVAAPASAANFAACSNGSLMGSYAITASGEIIGVGPMSVVGRVTFDGNGNVTKNLAHIVVNGQQPAQDWLTGTGTYSVSSDCTGAIHLDFSDGSKRNVVIVVTRGGRELRGVVSDPNVNTVANGVK